MSLLLTVLGLCVAFSIMTVVIILIKKGKLSDEYSSIWVFLSVMIVLSVLLSEPILAFYSWLKGERGAGQDILMFGALVFVAYFLILLSVQLSTKNRQITRLSQEMALLKNEINKNKEKK